MVKKTGTALEAMGRCRKLFWIFFFRQDYEPSPTGCSVVRTSKDVEKLGKACWKLSSKMEDSRNRMGYKPNIIQPFYEDTVRIQRDNQSYVWYAVVQKGLHSKLWQFYCRTIRKKKSSLQPSEIPQVIHLQRKIHQWMINRGTPMTQESSIANHTQTSSWSQVFHSFPIPISETLL